MYKTPWIACNVLNTMPRISRCWHCGLNLFLFGFVTCFSVLPYNIISICIIVNHQNNDNQRTWYGYHSSFRQIVDFDNLNSKTLLAAFSIYVMEIYLKTVNTLFKICVLVQWLTSLQTSNSQNLTEIDATQSCLSLNRFIKYPQKLFWPFFDCIGESVFSSKRKKTFLQHIFPIP